MMMELYEGQQFMLGTRAGLMKLTVRKPAPDAAWRLMDSHGEPVFEISADGSLTPVRPINDPTIYHLTDLNEWASRV